jgi:uncharacterized membrane protein YuzA (DUF378 family)
MVMRKDVHTYNIVRKKLFMFVMVFLILGALNYLSIALFKINFIQKITRKEKIAEIVYLLIGLSALYIMFDRDTYLPFLGRAVFPCDVLVESMPRDATLTLTLKVRPNSKVIFWASNPSTTGEITDYKGAYGNYENSGVTKSNGEGIVKLNIMEPQPYYVPYKSQPYIFPGKNILPRHVHYRVCYSNGLIGPIRTVYLATREII